MCHGKNLAHPDAKLSFLDEHERIIQKKTAKMFFN